MKKFRALWLVMVIAGSWSLLQSAGAGGEVTKFHETGFVVDIQTFYNAAKVQSAGYRSLGGNVGELALVTKSGVYAFLETPGNSDHLQGIAPGTAVDLKGRLLVNGALLHIDGLKAVKKAPGIDLDAYRSAAGEEVSLTGYNLCQCGLNVGELPHSCQLGHLHHLQASDGKIYHYLQYGEAQKTYLGIDSHFRPVGVKGRLLPGQYLLVASVTPR